MEKPFGIRVNRGFRSCFARREKADAAIRDGVFGIKLAQLVGPSERHEVGQAIAGPMCR